MGWLAIQGFEIHAFAAESEAENQRLEISHLAVRDTDAPSDTRATETLPFKEDLDQVVMTHVGDSCDWCHEFF